MEPITHASATTFASVIMKMLLCYGFCHTAVLDKDAKYVGVCSEALDLLQINACFIKCQSQSHACGEGQLLRDQRQKDHV